MSGLGFEPVTYRFIFIRVLEKLSTHKKELKRMKHVIPEFYLMVKKLEAYQELNYTGCQKICKKHDKILNRTTGKEFVSDVVSIAAFYTNKQIIRIIRDLEDLMTDLECGNTKGRDEICGKNILQSSPREDF